MSDLTQQTVTNDRFWHKADLREWRMSTQNHLERWAYCTEVYMKKIKLLSLIIVLFGSITSGSIWAAARGGGGHGGEREITML